MKDQTSENTPATNKGSFFDLLTNRFPKYHARVCLHDILDLFVISGVKSLPALVGPCIQACPGMK
jgi:hypothetical protein